MVVVKAKIWSIVKSQPRLKINVEVFLFGLAESVLEVVENTVDVRVFVESFEVNPDNQNRQKNQDRHSRYWSFDFKVQFHS